MGFELREAPHASLEGHEYLPYIDSCCVYTNHFFYIFGQKSNCLSANMIIAKKHHCKNIKKLFDANFNFSDFKGIFSYLYAFYFLFLFLSFFMFILNFPSTYLIIIKNLFEKTKKNLLRVVLLFLLSSVFFCHFIVFKK